jgi:hypothetical protein
MLDPYKFALTTLTSCNHDETLTETIFSPNQSQSVLLISHFVACRILSLENQESLSHTLWVQGRSTSDGDTSAA